MSARSLELLLIMVATLVLASVTGSALAAPEQAPVLTQQPGRTDPLVVVDDFLAARNARDALGATAFSARQLAIHGVQGQWIGDEQMVRAWLRHLTDTYLIDTLVRPHADGERVVWVERLTRRGLPYREALASSVEITVEVVVQGGSITSYSALYPGVSPQLSGAAIRPATDRPSTDSSGLSPAALTVDSAVGLAAAALLVLKVGPAIWRVRHRTRDESRFGAAK